MNSHVVPPRRHKAKVMTSQKKEEEEEEFEDIEDYNNNFDDDYDSMSPMRHPRKRKSKNAGKLTAEQNVATKCRQGVIRPPEVLDLTDSASSSSIQCRSNRFDASDMAPSDEEEEKRIIAANRAKRLSKADKPIPSRIEPALAKILFKRILDLRSRMGEEENKAPHIFMGRHLAENISRLAPITIDELKLCGSMSAKKLWVGDIYIDCRLHFSYCPMCISSSSVVFGHDLLLL